MELYDTVTMLEGMKAQPPVRTFLRDRFFPFAGEKDCFATEKVLVDYEDEGSEKLAPAVVSGGINVQRNGFSSKEYTAPLIAPQRTLTASQLYSRTFNESPFGGMAPDKREAIYLAGDLNDLAKMIARTEESMCAQILTENKFAVKVFQNDYATKAQEFKIEFFGEGKTASEAVYAPENLWTVSGGDPLKDAYNMAKKLTDRGLPATTVILGASAAEAFLKNEDLIKKLDNRRIQLTDMQRPQALENGAVWLGRYNCYGFNLDFFSYTASYTNDENKSVYYIPANKMIVTAEGIGKRAYGAITQYEEGSDQAHTYVSDRVPQVTINRHDNIKEIKLQSRPLPTPNHINPFYVADVTA